MAWYVARTRAQKESQAAAILDQRGVNVYLPLLKKRKVRAGSRAQDPLFPCYLFAEVEVGTDAWLATRSAPYVNYFLGQRGVPTELPADFVTALRARVDVENTSGSPPRFEPGERVLITSGPFQYLEAIFDRRLSASGRSLVLLQLLNQLVRVDVGEECLDKAT
jgi:transcriptional antiterminator RfaH